MKKIIYVILVIVSVFATSCSNDDIEITKTGKLCTLTYHVNTKGMYDEFDLTDDITDILREQNFCIGVTSFIYDAGGTIVDTKFTYQYTFNNVSEELKLPEGSYTIVTIETLVNPNNGFQANDWSFVRTDKLSTLQISQDSYEVYYPFVLGTSIMEINVMGNQAIQVTPKAIGSLLQLSFLNFDKSTYPSIGFATNDIIDTYRMDPILSRDDRFNTDLTTIGYFNIRAQSKVGGKSSVSLTRYVLESSISYTFCFKKKEDENNRTWTFYNGNKGKIFLQDGEIYYGGFYYVDDNTPGKFVFGSKQDFENWFYSLNKKEEPFIPELYLMWGNSVSNAQSAMKNYTMTEGTSGRAVLQEDGSYGISYAGMGKVSKISYFFTSATTGLFEVDVRYDKKTVSLKEMLDYLNNKYTYLVDQDGIYMYLTTDQKSFVLFSEYQGAWNVGFVDVNYVNATRPKKFSPVYSKIKNLNVLAITKNKVKDVSFLKASQKKKINQSRKEVE